MINRAQVLSEQFTIPEYQPTLLSGGNSQTTGAPEFKLPDALQGLQVTGDIYNKSRQYYKKLADLDQFAKSMWLNYRIDVTKKDFSRPEAVAAADAFAQELANTQALGNELKVSQDERMKFLDAQAKGEYAFNPATEGIQPFANQLSHERGVYTGLSDLTKKAIDEFSGGRQTPGIIRQEEGEAQARYQQMLDYANRLEATNPTAAAQIRDQAEKFQLGRNMYLAPPSDQGIGTGAAISGLITDVADVFGGGHPSYRPTGRVKGNYQVYESTNSAALNNVPSDIFKYGKPVRFEKVGPEVFIVSSDTRDAAVPVSQSNLYPALQQHMSTMGLTKEFKQWVDANIASGRFKQTKNGVTIDAADLMSEAGTINRADYDSKADYTAAVQAFDNKAKEDLKDMLRTEGIGDVIKRGFNKLADQFRAIPQAQAAPLESGEYDSSLYPGYKIKIERKEKDGKATIVVKLVDDSGTVVSDNGEDFKFTFNNEQDALEQIKTWGGGAKEILSAQTEFDSDI